MTAAEAMTQKVKLVALLGNPNVGKTTLFNALTGLRHTTANYPGVTVEKRLGKLKLKSGEEAVDILDLPGTYSLKPKSLDEEIVCDVLKGAQPGTGKPDLVVLILDANNFDRNLYLALQVLETGIPLLLVLNMWDEVQKTGKRIDLGKIREDLGMACLTTVGHRGTGVPELKAAIQAALIQPPRSKAGLEIAHLTIAQRYALIDRLAACIVTNPARPVKVLSDKIDDVLTHPVWGWILFAAVMTVIFQSIFSWAAPFMDLIASGVQKLGAIAAAVLPDGQLESLVVDGVIAGVGNVIVFLPQIFLLFFFIALFEDFGYMARAAFVLDRVMKKVGLNGKAFLPLLSSFACAIPGIMATRTIQDKNDRLATILVAPLMSCSARLPVYALMIGAFIPPVRIFGFLDLKGLTLLSMYFLSIFTGLAMAAFFRKTLLKGEKTPFLLELPPYRIPRLPNVILTMWDRGKEFLFNAGSIIFCISIILWFLVSYPKNESVIKHYEHLRGKAAQSLVAGELQDRLTQIDHEEAGALLKKSYAGRLGQWIEPVIRPLGFDWKIGVGLVASFAAREVLVSTLAIIYNVGGEANETSADLRTSLQRERDPVTGKPVYTPLVALAIMVFFVLACQCMSTVAIVRRETGGWGWPVFMLTYMTALAWTGAFVTYQGGRLLGVE
ncbi:MAG: ferrous iron transport protein B [Omnitrophica bacterium GWA2_52_8]|nr:MAG: ferrous iron transport protein B [Omnitrophica bacterium GWA2_52_8]